MKYNMKQTKREPIKWKIKNNINNDNDEDEDDYNIYI